ncbi:TetR/AcrR family transcriptional regulator C-terminal domain-containing protein [Couchioplanes caeruleus]|uniref:TetR/AcrR family transcriptional regulator C-terminal domain-containing protein n=1 Tax=Couchioplanes caeruleus TaxID=56438 RepID=UPI00201CA646|nr:TetR/AcrR family transcriptional regulator C-terminal domain-containing protein [Couchioplanes caeruleus]UQU66107.1 TetR/AcrR family transcriptional regulator C-terminal domain-containing protein [Couchioplanes caeruleus]
MKGLTREVLIRTALRLLDEVGLDGLTVRKLAAELGVQSPALYWHIRTKQELLDGMANEIILRAGMGPPLDGESWQEWLRRRARAYRQSVLASRDGARVVSGGGRGGAAVQHFEAELAAMVRLGFTPVQALRTITTLSHYINGHVLQEQAVIESPGSPDLSGLPTLTAALHGGSPVGEEVFEHGLDVFIAGTESRLAAAPGRTDPSPR